MNTNYKQSNFKNIVDIYTKPIKIMQTKQDIVMVIGGILLFGLFYILLVNV